MQKILTFFSVLLVLVWTSNANAQYCAGGPTTTADSNVESVTLTGDASSAINYTGCPGVLGLEDSTATHSANVTANSSYTANVLFGTCGGNYSNAGEAWIDWNQNQTFEASESIGTWTGTPPATATPFTFTVPATAFNGSTRLRVMQQENGSNPLNPCAGFAYGSVVDFTIVVSGGVANTCPIPSALTTNNITTTTADLGWTENGTATSWQVEYGAQGFAQGTGTFAVSNSNPYNASSLTANTAYSFYVRSICGAGDTSAWVGPVNFTTPCAVYTPAHLEDFSTFLPACWEEAADGTPATGPTGLGGGEWNHSAYLNTGSNNAVKINLYDTGTRDWLLAPTFDLSAGTWELVINAGVTNYNGTNAIAMGSDDTVQVLISTNGGTTWTPIYTWDAANAPSNTGNIYTIDLSAHNNANTRFAIWASEGATNDPQDYDFHINDFEIRIPPACPAPSTGTANNATTTTVDLGWTENGSATAWQIEHGPAGFAQGTGTLTLANSNPYNLTSLSPSSSYNFYVRAICGAGDTSTWAGPFNFQTACGAIVAPFMETFAANGLPNCWLDMGNDSYIFNTAGDYGASSAGDRTTGGGTNYAWVDGSGAGNTFDTLTSPPINMSGLTTPNFCFSLFSNNTNDAGNNTISIEFYDGATWHTLARVQQNLGTSWVDFSYDLSGFTITGNAAVRFVTNTNSTADAYYNDILIDDIAVNNGGCPTTPVCLRPAPSTLTATNITATSADLGWFTNTGSSNWQIEWGAQGFAQGTGTVVVTGTNPHPLSGLTQNTTYDYYIRTICGAGDSSIVAGPYSFTTLANCPFPSALTATNITATSADFGWTENGTATSWQVEYGAQGFTQGTGTFAVSSSNPYNASSLTSGTSYSFYVRAICGAGDSSAWVGPFNFATLCAVYTPAYLEDFSTFVPNCWDEAGDGFPSAGPSNVGTGEWNHTGYLNTGSGNAAKINLYDTGTNDWLIAPTFDLSSGSWELVINAGVTNYNGSNAIAMGSDDTVQVLVSTNGGTTWAPIYTWDAANAPTNTGNMYTIDISAYNSATTQFAIWATEGTTNDPEDYDFHINDFEIRAFAPPPPPNLVITEIMYNPPESGTDSLEFIEIYNNGSAPANLNNFTLDGFVYTFPNVSLAAGAYYVVAVDAAAFTNVFGNAPDGEATSGGLSNGGEPIVIRDQNGMMIDSVRYDDSGVWPSGAAAGQPDGGGASLILCDTASDNNDGNNWSASMNATGATVNSLAVLASPGAANTCPTPPADVTPASFLNLDTTYCNVAAVTGSVIITNTSANTATNIPYVIVANSLVLASDTIASLAGMASDTITVGPVPATTSGFVTVGVITSLAGDTDMSNDTLTMPVFISNTDASASVTAAIACNGDSTGEARAIGANGLATLYNYQWDANANNQTAAIATGLPAGTYTVTVTDTIGCADTATVTLVAPTALAIADSITNVTCNGDSNGMAMITVTGGTPAYSYAWSNSDTTAMINDIMAGVYTVTVTDNNGCTATSGATITEPSALVAAIADNGDGTATASATGGTAAYNYAWDAAASNQTTATATGLTNNTTYVVTVSDANGCVDTASVTVTIVGVETIANLAHFNMFPNPTSGNVFVELELAENATVEISIVNALGQIVGQRVLPNVQAEKVELETADFTSGVYMVHFNINNKQFTRKLIISKQ